MRKFKCNESIENIPLYVCIHSMGHKRPALRPFNAFRAIDMPVKDKISHADKVTQRGVR